MHFCEETPSELKFIPKLSHTIIDKIKQLPLDEAQIHGVKLSLGEALSNAIRHGNKLNPDLAVRVKVEAGSRSLTIWVADQGKGFNFRNAPDPTKPDKLHKLSGRGIFLIRKHMDKVTFLERGRKIKMVKLFKKGEGK
ncbi:MAG: ATP-binding protein [Candidatus Omnitrophota bacterium]